MITLLIYFVIACILFGFAYWIIGQTLPPPAAKFAYILLAAVAVIVVVYVLLHLAGGTAVSLPRIR